MLSNSVKRKAQDDISTRPSKLIRSELKNNDIPSINTNDLKLIRNNIHHARKVLYPKLPKSMQETHNCLSTMNITTNKNDQFLFCNNLIDNIIGFSTETNLKALCDVTKYTWTGRLKAVQNISYNFLLFMDFEMDCMYHWFSWYYPTKH